MTFDLDEMTLRDIMYIDIFISFKSSAVKEGTHLIRNIYTEV